MILKGDCVGTSSADPTARRLHSMVNVGIIGVGATWELRYLPALCRLGHRIRVRAVYDPVAARAHQVAAEIGAVTVDGMLALASRSDVQAILVLDPSWHGVRAVSMLSRLRKPIYFANCLAAESGVLEELRSLADAERLTLYPELARRYTPASSRLQELLATRLGRPRRIRIETSARSVKPEMTQGTGLPSDLIALLDWCSYVFRRPPASITMQSSDPDPRQHETERTIVLVFQPPKGGGDPPVAELRLAQKNGNGDAHSDPEVRCEIECERGTASLSSADRITWCGDSGPVDESLATDRPDVEVMLDQFCRRVVGGLIPVADVGDLCRGARLLRVAEESLRTGRAVALGGEGRAQA